MTRTWTTAPLATVRHLIAETLTASDAIPDHLGEITLRAHQRNAAERLTAIISKHGGAMLAEPVGLGKTYTALAVAAHNGGTLLVVAPASLRDMWQSAAQRAAIDLTFASYESLSRGSMPSVAPDFIIADEAHRVRSANTRRHALLAELARRAKLLLVTATPVQNRRGDLSAQLALFLGRAAWQWSDQELTELVVRDSDLFHSNRPALNGPHRITLDVDDDCLDRLASLPPPIPARDESVAAALVTFGLLHQWTSSRSALVAALRRRRARGIALIAALEAGRRPTKSELAAWTHAGDSLQLAFTEIVAPVLQLDFDAAPLLASVQLHNDAIDSLIRHLRGTPDPDDARGNALRRIRRMHPNERIIAFCQYTETVSAMRTRFIGERGIATLTASGARVAGGPIARREVIAQFAPASESGAAIHERERIDLLITTDLLSEGLNLQEASVIVHLDLPWNPARLDQRVGRALRLGSRHQTVSVYAIAPPAPAERLLRLESRLRDKLRVAQRTIGVAGNILPSIVSDLPSENALTEQQSAFAFELRRWRLDGAASLDQNVGYVAAIPSPDAGFLALVRASRGPILVADLGAGIDSRIAPVRTAITRVGGGIEVEVDTRRANDAVLAIDQWLAAQRATATIDIGAIAATRARRTTLARVSRALARAPRHQRASMAPLAEIARSVASAQLAEGAERILETLSTAKLPDEAWLRSIAAFGEANVRSHPRPNARPEIMALILFQQNDSGPGT